MKRKILMFGICLSFLLTGCGSNKDAMNELEQLSKNDSYYIEGNLEIINNEDSYKYDINVSYKKDDYYKVELINLVNDHKQIILKNSDGVYVLTPSLNKSFKFQSDWPYNNSQIYIIQNIIDDIKNDENRTIETKDNGYIITSKVNYSNNSKLVKQKVYFKNNINKVEVLNEDDTVLMTMEFKKVEFNKTFDDNYFDLDTCMEVSSNLEVSSVIDEVVYPLYVPDNTALTNQSKLETDTGERIILTFSGDKSFMLVESTIDTTNSLLPVFGEVTQVNDTLGILNENSLTWYGNNLEYYLTSSDMSAEELLTVANSLGTIMVGK